jgi:hypothetical protein
MGALNSRGNGGCPFRVIRVAITLRRKVRPVSESRHHRGMDHNALKSSGQSPNFRTSMSLNSTPRNSQYTEQAERQVG